MRNQLTLPFQIESNVTPMMKQYLDIKMGYPDAILFYRMGDFYEMFFDDAITAAPILGISLTKRGQSQGEAIPMCGVPFHSSDSYIARLIEAGKKVVICEQMETPDEAKKRGYKAVVRREAVRIITPGTITEDNLLSSGASNFLLSIACFKNNIAIAWADISTGELYVSESSIASLNNDLARINPKEILISDKLYNQEEVNVALADYRRIVTIQANSLFEASKAEYKVKQYYNVISSNVFGEYNDTELVACGVLLEYVELTQKTNSLKINHPKKQKNTSFMNIDAATRRNLELNITSNGDKRGSLLNLLNRTRTSSGSRLLAQYLASPLLDVEAINKRLEIVEFFIQNTELTESLVNSLSCIGDVERSLARLGFNRGGPRDLQVIKNSLIASNDLLTIFLYFKGNIPIVLQAHLSNLENCDSLLLEELSSALLEDLPALARDGGFIKPEYNHKLDQLKALKNNSNQALQILKQKYIQATGINSLKINHNNVLGYFIDITPPHVDKIKEDVFIHRQTLANSIRYTTIELRELENEILNVSDSILKLELQIYDQLVSCVLEKTNQLILFAHSVASIDVLSSFAINALEYNYVKPVLDNSLDFHVIQGRHPVIETVLKIEGQEFISNDCNLTDKQKLWLITGPNMAGKSTFLRQNALIAIMAQVGSYVPAKEAKFGVIDKIYSRVGAADDLARGRSTFMVEMIETANILNNATNKSLIILDEIGRGTSTYDGVSIASACLEFIHDKVKARALFATHYHELTSLKEQLDSLVCYTIQIKEWQNKVIFLHKVIAGVADKSYGIHVAALAGLPQEVIFKAKHILSNLERKHNHVVDCDIHEPPVQENHLIFKMLEELDVDSLTPREAMDMLYQLKKLLK